MFRLFSILTTYLSSVYFVFGSDGNLKNGDDDDSSSSSSSCSSSSSSSSIVMEGQVGKAEMSRLSTEGINATFK